DAAPAPNAQCSGDSAEYGASGVRIADLMPNTDPLLGAHHDFEHTRVIAYAGPGKDASFARQCAAEARQPPTATARPYAPLARAPRPGRPCPATPFSGLGVFSVDAPDRSKIKSKLGVADTRDGTGSLGPARP